MDVILNVLGMCNSLQKADINNEDDASEIQLNAFEFRNYRTSLEPSQQKLLERVVNQWCSMLVKGKTMKVNNFDDKVQLDKDLLVLEYKNFWLPLKSILRMELFKDRDEILAVPYGLEITFEGRAADTILRFHFEHERQRLNFALTLRILRTRDPTLDPAADQMKVVLADDEDPDDDRFTFHKIASTQHYSTDASIPVVFSVSDMKIYEKLQSSSRHVYLEFFVKYPRQDQFLYAKSPTAYLKPQVLLGDDVAIRRKKEKQDDEEDEERKKEEQKRQVLGQDVPKDAMKFDLKNVKLKIPKVPHALFGRLMAKDDYFPTAVGTFDFEFKRQYLQDRRTLDPQDRRRERLGKDDGTRKEPEVLAIPVMSSWKSFNKDTKEESFIKIGLLTIRIIGYITDRQGGDSSKAGSSPSRSKGSPSKDNNDRGGDDEEEEEEESDED